MRTLFAVYPDARVVQIHRDPLKSVPSTISLMGTIRSTRCAQVDVDTLVPWVSLGYAAMLDDTVAARGSGELPDDQFVDVRYADLMADPAAAISQVYGDLGLALPSALPEAVSDYVAARPKGARGAHRYSLADTGLDEATERERFRSYQARHNVPDET
jgi:hypothetical protein